MSDKLLPYQVSGAKRLRSLNRAILADDMGLGKTRQAIAAAATKDHQHVLIITLNGLQTSWKREIETLLGPGQAIEVYDGKQVAGTARWVIIHYEGAKLDRNSKVLLERSWDCVIVDEAHRCKTRRIRTNQKRLTNYGLVDGLSRRTDALYLLTGTPMRQSPADLWPLLHFIDRQRYSSFWRWVPEYVVYDQTYFGKKPVGYKNLDRLAEELRPVTIRRTKAEVIDELPAKRIHTVYCQMEKEQAKLYKQMVEDYVAELRDGVYMSAPTEVSKLMRLRQIATDATLLTWGTSPGFVNSGKVEVLFSLVHRIIYDEGEKVLIFSNWSSMVERLAQALRAAYSDDAVLTYTGNTPKHERPAIVDRFQTDPTCKMFIGTIGAAGTGLTLTAASKVIFTDRAWTPDDNAQAEDRAYARMNDLHGVDVYKLITEGTVDESVDRYIEQKATTVEQVIGLVRDDLLKKI